MNRLTAVLLAMAALLVHVLAIHRNEAGELAHSFEAAGVAHHLGTRLADAGTSGWGAVAMADGARVGPRDLGSYPSPLLVWLAALLRLVGANVERGVQLVGVLCTLATVFLSTRFDTDRIAGVIPALLLVSSGAVAAAGASGTEWPLAMFALALSFVSLEHGRARFAALGLVLLVVAAPAGVVAAAALGVQTLLRRRGRRQRDRQAPLWPFAPAVVAVVLAHLAGASLLPELARAARFAPDAMGQGVDQLRDHLVSTVTPVLLVFPLLVLLRGRLSRCGRRALALTATWYGATVLLGGGPSPFVVAFAPALPVAFVAIQQGMARVLDTYLRSMERLVWASLSVAIVGALLASRFPGDLGRIELRALHERLLASRAATGYGLEPVLARVSLYSEIRLTEQLRAIGESLGDRLDPATTVLAPWPGALAQRSGLTVVDAFGRVAALPGIERAPWTPVPGRFDARAALACEADYVLPAMGSLDAYAAGELPDLLPSALLELDPADGDELRREVRAALARYELLVTVGDGSRADGLREPLLLLRRRGIGRARELGVTEGPRGLELTARFRPSGEAAVTGSRGSLRQVFDVHVVALLPGGGRRLLDPTGAPATGEATLRGVVMDPLWQRPVTLVSLDAATREALAREAIGLEARLVHHRVPPSDPRADAAPPLKVALD